MCLDIKSGPHIAEKDIPVLKILTSFSKSIYRSFPYKPNETYKADMRILDMQIHEGLHAYDPACIEFFHREPDDLIEVRLVYGPKGCYLILDIHRRDWTRLAEFTIPARATYYVGTNGDLVSDTIRSGSLNNEWDKYEEKC